MMTSTRPRLCDIIEESTRQDVIVISHDTVMEFKSLLRGDNLMIELCFDALFSKLRDNHPQTRLLALMLVNVVFRRSKHFRELIVNNLEILFELTLPIHPHNPLPPPSKTALYLTEQSIEFIEEWCQDFGHFYFRLQLGYQHLVQVHHIHFPNKRLKQKQQQKRKQMNHIKQLKAKLTRFVQLTSKFEQKYPKIIAFLHEFQGKMEKITPSFDSMLQCLSQNKNVQIIGFSDDESDDQDDGDLNLELPSLPGNSNTNNAIDAPVDDFLNTFDFTSSCQHYGIHRNYSLKVTIDTDFKTYSNKNKQNHEAVLKQIATYRYLTENKLRNQVEEWRCVMINADLSVITNRNKQIACANQRMDILSKLDDIDMKISSLISKCDTLNIQSKNNWNRTKKKIDNRQRVHTTQYVDVKASVAFANDDHEQRKQQEIKRRMLTRGKYSSGTQQQRKRILFKKLLTKPKKKKCVKFCFKLHDK
eukprot:53738_1